MKLVIIAVVIGILGFIGYSFMKGGCPGGRIVAHEAECRAAFGAEACRLAFAESERKAKQDYAPFHSLDACQRNFGRCEPHQAVMSGFVPTPTAVCVTPQGAGATGTPMYERIGRKFGG